jgi:hypothetical protein
VTWIWDANSGVWANMGSMTSIVEIGSFDKKIMKVVDILVRESKDLKNQTLFYIYDDGTVKKRIVIE